MTTDSGVLGVRCQVLGEGSVSSGDLEVGGDFEVFGDWGAGALRGPQDDPSIPRDERGRGRFWGAGLPYGDDSSGVSPRTSAVRRFVRGARPPEFFDTWTIAGVLR